jgi:glutamate carboxypeptidase
MSQSLEPNLYQKYQEAQGDFIKFWEQLVNIDTGTGYGAGLSEMGSLVIAFLQKLGAEVTTIPAHNPEEGFYVLATFQGTGAGSVMAMAHMDTVFPAGTAGKRPFCIKGEWAYGPGVSDCKGSITMCLYAMKLLREMDYRNYGKITCLFNCDEEIGSPSSRELIRTLAQQHDYVLCCEPGQVGDGVVLWRKGSAVMQVEAYGRSAHAGSAPQDGRNAIMELLQQITQLSRLEDGKRQLP